VLDLSQIETGQLTLSRGWSDIDEVVGEAIQAVEPLFFAKGLTLTRVQAAPTSPVFFDRLRIRQILLSHFPTPQDAAMINTAAIARNHASWWKATGAGDSCANSKKNDPNAAMFIFPQ